MRAVPLEAFEPGQHKPAFAQVGKNCILKRTEALSQPLVCQK